MSVAAVRAKYDALSAHAGLSADTAGRLAQAALALADDAPRRA